MILKYENSAQELKPIHPSRYYPPPFLTITSFKLSPIRYNSYLFNSLLLSSSPLLPCLLQLKQANRKKKIDCITFITGCKRGDGVGADLAVARLPPPPLASCAAEEMLLHLLRRRRLLRSPRVFDTFLSFCLL